MIHPSQIAFAGSVHSRSGASASKSILALYVLLGVGIAVKSPPLRPFVFGSGLVVAASARDARRLAVDSERVASDVDSISHTAWQEHLYKSLKAAKESILDAGEATLQPVLEAGATVQYYPWPNIKELPHLFFLGSTGDGKTTLCRWALQLLPGAHLCLDPHAAPDKWAGLPVVGLGRDFGAIANALLQIQSLMISRFEQLASGEVAEGDFDPLNVVIDEFPAIGKALMLMDKQLRAGFKKLEKEQDPGTEFSKLVRRFPKLGELQDSDQSLTEILPAILREARKVGIRILLMAQGSEVKTLGCEGEGSLRDQLQWIRLGKFARDYGAKNPAFVAELARAERPCMVGDSLAVVPDLSNFTPQYQQFDLPAGLAQLVTKGKLKAG